MFIGSIIAPKLSSLYVGFNGNVTAPLTPVIAAWIWIPLARSVLISLERFPKEPEIVNWSNVSSNWRSPVAILDTGWGISFCPNKLVPK